MAESALDRRYAIQDNGSYFRAGHLPNGNQVLMGIQLPNVTLVEFDHAGSFVGVYCRPIATVGEPSSFSPAELADSGAVTIAVWQDQIGFVSATIHLRPFYIDSAWIGIRDLPEHYRDVIENPEDYDDERRETLMQDIGVWRERGDFVLEWCEEYYMDRAGEVTSS